MPDWERLVRERLRPLRIEAGAEADLAAEMAQHLEDCYRDAVSAGAAADQAYREAVAELEDLYPLRAGLRRSDRMPKHDAVPMGDARSGSLLADLGRDLRYALRTMRKSPGFVLAVVLTLALGIGANTTVFTVINTLILNPLPVPDASRLAAMGIGDQDGRSRSGLPMPMSLADFKDYQARNGVFDSLAAYSSPRLLTWQSGSTSQRMFGELTTARYFSTLGLKPAAGRFFTDDDDSPAGAHAVAVMNYGTWQQRFGGAGDIVGQTLRLNNVLFTVIGVAPPSFIGINSIFGPDVWIPAAMTEQLLPNEMQGALHDRSKAAFRAVGEYKPGVARPQAQANLTTIAAGLARAYPADQGHTAVVLPIRDVMFASSMGSTSPVLLASGVLLIVVGVVLLIACSNVANLLLARSAARQQEMSVRMAMGASGRRLVRQLLTESVLLGLMSGCVGLLLGYSGLKVLFGRLPGSSNFIAPKFDVVVFAFTLLISLGTGLLFGLLPALQASRQNVVESLKDGRSMGRARSRVTLGNALLVGQVAFSFLLLVTAALFLRSIGRAYDLDPGFQTAHLAIFMTNPGQTGYARPQTVQFYRDARERVARVPGVESVSWSSNLPLWGRVASGLRVEGLEERSKANQITTIVNTVDRDYFATAGVTIQRGREFSELDRENSTPVAIVNEKAAHDFWPGAEALGRRIQLPGEKVMRQVVGIARTANYSTWGEPPQFAVYVPLEQNYFDAMVLYIRSKGDPAPLVQAVQREVRTAGPQILVNDARTGRQIIENGLFQAKIGVGLLSVFGLLALGLASIGLYGIMAYSVNQRRREIGLRIALGAGQATVLGLVLKQGMSLVLAGVAIGFAAAVGVGRLLSGMLFGVGAGDPVSVAGAAVVLLAVALMACYFPARWASRVDPLVALREG